MTHPPLLKAFDSKMGSGMPGEASAEIGGAEPWERIAGKLCSGRAVIGVCSALRLESGPNEWENGACVSICL